MWKLVIEDDEGKRTVVPLTRDQYSIGRREGNTIRLTERNVSREHARLFKRNGAAETEKATFVLQDLTSYNGVFVNGFRLSHLQDLAHGDLVQIGDYRIVLQDEALADADTALGNDTKQTVPNAPVAPASTLLDRPNRLVMLAGPSPASEFPLDRDRMTIGRAEDANISVNHSSVSRLHAEVHALGDGRFEIVDKASSNGVRVNGAELRRGIIEPGDTIELGDVRFKFVGAGQIFRATDIHHAGTVGTERSVALGSRGAARTPNSLPLAAFVVIVVAGATGAWLYTRPHLDRAVSTASAASSPERTALEQAKRLCASGDCEAAHDRLATIGDTSPLHSSPDYRDVENRWADEILARAEREPDIATRRALYQRVAQTMTVEPMRRKAGADKLQELDMVATGATNPMQLPVAVSARPADDAAPSAPARPDTARRTVAAVEMPAVPAIAVPPPLPPPPTLPVATKPATASVDDRERQLALQGTQDAKLLLKQQLEQRVYGGKASDTEIRLLISTCKDLGDRPCVQQARAVQAQRGP